MSGVSAIVAMTPAAESTAASETAILTAATVQLEVSAPEPAPPQAPAAGTSAPYAGEIVREEAVTAAPVDPDAAAKPETILKLDWQTDLTQIETNPVKQRARDERAVEEVPAPRPKRVRQPIAPLDEGPLVQIETQRPAPASMPVDAPAPGSAPTPGQPL
jgi:ribonuclease E